MKTALKKIYALVALLVFAGFIATPLSVYAAEGTLAVKDLHDRNGKAISGMQVSLFQIAHITESGEIQISAEFSGIIQKEELADIQSKNADSLRSFAEHIRAGERAGDISPLETVVSDAEGKASFASRLGRGIYLLDYKETGHFSSSPSLVSVPVAALDAGGGFTENYSIVLSGKIEDDTPAEPPRPSEPHRPRHDDPDPEPPTTPASPPEEPPENPNDPGNPPPTEDGDVLGAFRRPAEKTVERVLGAMRNVATGDESMAGIFLIAASVSLLGLIRWFFWKRKRDERAE